MSQKGTLAKLFRLFAATIDNLDEHQIDQLIAGKAKLTFTPANNSYQVFSMIPPANTYTAFATVGTATLPTSPIPISGSNVSISRTVTFQFAAGGTVTETTNTPYFWITNPWGGSNKITVSGVGNVSVSSP